MSCQELTDRNAFLEQEIQRQRKPLSLDSRTSSKEGPNFFAIQLSAQTAFGFTFCALNPVMLLSLSLSLSLSLAFSSTKALDCISGH